MSEIGREELTRLLEMGSGPVCGTLYDLLGKRAELTVVDVNKVGKEDIASHLPRFNVVIEGAGPKGRRAGFMVIFRKEDMARLANYIMGNDLDRENPMDEVSVAVLSKVALQCMKSAAEELEDLLGCNPADLKSFVEIYEGVEPVLEKIGMWGTESEICMVSGLMTLDGIFTANFLMAASRQIYELLDSSRMAELSGEEGAFGENTADAAKKEKVIAVQDVYFPEFKYEPLEDTVDYISDERTRILDVSVDVAVRVGGTVCSVKDILAMQEGQVLTLDKQAGAPADIVVNGALIGHGDIIVTDDHFAARINEILDKKE